MIRLQSIEHVSGDEDDGEAGSQPVPQLCVSSDESEAPDSLLCGGPKAPSKKKRKRVSSGPSVKDRLSSDALVKNFLATKSKCCGRNCLTKFRQPELFGKLMEFRKEFSSLSKRDQDHVVPDFSTRAVYCIQVFFLKCVFVK